MNWGHGRIRTSTSILDKSSSLPTLTMAKWGRIGSERALSKTSRRAPCQQLQQMDIKPRQATVGLCRGGESGSQFGTRCGMSDEETNVRTRGEGLRERAEARSGRQRIWLETRCQVLQTQAADAKERAGSLRRMLWRRSSWQSAKNGWGWWWESDLGLRLVLAGGESAIFAAVACQLRSTQQPQLSSYQAAR